MEPLDSEIVKNLRQSQGFCLERWHSKGRAISKYGNVQRLVGGKKTRWNIQGIRGFNKVIANMLAMLKDQGGFNLGTQATCMGLVTTLGGDVSKARWSQKTY